MTCQHIYSERVASLFSCLLFLQLYCGITVQLGLTPESINAHQTLTEQQKSDRHPFLIIFVLWKDTNRIIGMFCENV